MGFVVEGIEHAALAVGDPLVRHVAFRVDRANFEAAQRDLTRRGIGFELQDV